MAKNPAQTTTVDQLTNFAVRLGQMHIEAMQLGLYSTGHKLHDAVRAVGFEICEVRKKAIK